MTFVSKLTAEQWAEARSMRAAGTSYQAIASHFEIAETTVRKRAGRDGWSAQALSRASRTAAPARKAPRASPATATIRSRLALRLYAILECKIRMMELRMMKALQAHEKLGGDHLAPAPPMSEMTDDRESFAALIASINQVTEMASEPATAPDGRRKSAAGSARDAINPELTALSADIDPDGLAVASEKDNYRRELAERLGKMFPKS